MPSRTPKQHRFMEAIAHGMKPRAGGPTKQVAREFVAADKGRPVMAGKKPKKKGGGGKGC